MINPEIEKFLQDSDMSYMFCLLANKEIERMNKLPQSIKDAFKKTITEEALEHIAKNYIPDYMFESNEAMIKKRDEDIDMSKDDDDDDTEELMGIIED
ncbi:hypothetical protein JEZ13_07270 [bacterium]|nr:hypothetical protein [bacterium]